MSVLIARSVISLGVCIVFDYSRVKLTFLRRNLICLCRMYWRWCHSLFSLSYESNEVDSHYFVEESSSLRVPIIFYCPKICGSFRGLSDKTGGLLVSRFRLIFNYSNNSAFIVYR